MAVDITAGPVSDVYLDLVRRFPLTRIKDDKHLKAAIHVIDALLQEDLDAWGQEYFDVLTDLVESYEEQHVRLPDASQVDVLEELLRSNNLSQSQLCKHVGIARSTFSAILTGRRSLTKDQANKLAKFFNVSPAAFLPDHGRA
jgi:HTH-type transcriptional regulator / antitoxin HigA